MSKKRLFKKKNTFQMQVFQIVVWEDSHNVSKLFKFRHFAFFSVFSLTKKILSNSDYYAMDSWQEHA